MDDKRTLRLNLDDSPYSNFFYADDETAAQLVISSPGDQDNPKVVRNRLLIAWPAGNSGVAYFFDSSNADNESPRLKAEYLPSGDILAPVRDPLHSSESSSRRSVISGQFHLSKPALLSTSILGSVRTIRDFTEGNGLLRPEFQDGIRYSRPDNHPGGLRASRVWLDGKTLTETAFYPVGNGDHVIQSVETGATPKFDAGSYIFEASINNKQFHHLSPDLIFDPKLSADEKVSDFAKSLSFFSYSENILSGAWRFLTYFGRDLMISMLLMSPVLNHGDGGIVEAALSAVIERIDYHTGSVCHEETLGDYATWMHRESGTDSADPVYDYKMIDTDFYLPIFVKRHFLDGDVNETRRLSFFAKQVESLGINHGKSYLELLRSCCAKIIKTTAAFAEPNGQTAENLISFKPGQPVGNWRDSMDGLGGGTIPYDVNTALVPAALRAISEITATGIFQDQTNLFQRASEQASVWEEHSLPLFECTLTKSEATRRIQDYVTSTKFPGPSRVEEIGQDLRFYAVSIESGANPTPVEIMNSDDCFRLFFLPYADSIQHRKFLDQAAENVLRTFPAGLFSPIGVFIANPAFSKNPRHSKVFTRGDYHGTVVWSWNSLAMLAKGLELQILKYTHDVETKSANTIEPQLLIKLRKAYSKLWDTIDQNFDHLGNEVWSWEYDKSVAGGFKYTPIGRVATSDGKNQTESNIRQLWSLTFLAVKRNRSLEIAQG